jgi:archaellum component FlaD/FlaE
MFHATVMHACCYQETPTFSSYKSKRGTALEGGGRDKEGGAGAGAGAARKRGRGGKTQRKRKEKKKENREHKKKENRERKVNLREKEREGSERSTREATAKRQEHRVPRPVLLFVATRGTASTNSTSTKPLQRGRNTVDRREQKNRVSKQHNRNKEEKKKKQRLPPQPAAVTPKPL